MTNRSFRRLVSGRFPAACILAALLTAWLFSATGGVCEARPVIPELRTPLGKALRWVPDGANILMSFNVGAILRSEAAKTLIKEFPKVREELEEEFTREVGLKFEEMQRVTLAGSPKDRGPIVVMELNQAITPAAFLARLRNQDWQEEDVGGETIHVDGRNGRDAWYFPDDRTIVGGPTDLIRQVVIPDRKPSLSKPLRGYVDRLDFAQGFIVTFIVEDTEKHFLPPIIPMADPEQFKAFVFQGNVSTDARFTADLVCRDTATAIALEQTIKMGLDQVKNEQGIPEAVRELLDAIQTSVAGDKVQGKATLPMRLLRALAQAIADAM